MLRSRNPNTEFQCRHVGEGLEEAEIVEWKVLVGQQIAVNQVVVEIVTAKSLVEPPSPFAGTVLELLAGGASCSRRSSDHPRAGIVRTSVPAQELAGLIGRG
jgi:hypothetical protein